MKSPTPFTMIPNWVFTSGMFTDWSHATAKVYVALLSFVNAETRLAYPSLRKLVILTKISRTTVSASLTELWKCGAICIRRPGLKTVNCYYLPLDPAKCPSNLDAYLSIKPIRQAAKAKRLASNLLGRPPSNLLGHKQEVLNKRKEDKPIYVTVQNTVQNIVQRAPQGQDPQITTRIERRGVE